MSESGVEITFRGVNVKVVPIIKSTKSPYIQFRDFLPQRECHVAAVAGDHHHRVAVLRLPPPRP